MFWKAISLRDYLDALTEAEDALSKVRSRLPPDSSFWDEHHWQHYTPFRDRLSKLECDRSHLLCVGVVEEAYGHETYARAEVRLSPPPGYPGSPAIVRVAASVHENSYWYFRLAKLRAGQEVRLNLPRNPSITVDSEPLTSMPDA